MLNFINNISIEGPYPEHLKEIVFGAGCFWGVEKRFWELDGVYVTSVGYSGGDTENPSYEDVCYKNTNHAEVVKVVYDPNIIELKQLLKVFWECHDPTQGMRQGNDVGTQYRSVIYVANDEDFEIVNLTKKLYQKELVKNNFKPEDNESITTEVAPLEKYYLAEEYHQQYLAKNPNGYCGIGGTGCTLEV
tara:strand:- start:2279 stop:2848 length:570 start_codon:yes stop_codon:yes gene_type:complete